MHLVALSELTGTLEAEVAALARDLGATPYDIRLLLAGGTPAIVLTTPDPGRASALVEAMRARRQVAVACSLAEVVPASAMISMRRFALEREAIVAVDADVRLPALDVLCLLRATVRRDVTTTTETEQRKIAPGKAVLTGGLALTKREKTTVTSTSEERDQVLYVFRRSGETPWLLNESRTQYGGLGADLAPTSVVNFQTTIRRLRGLSPNAVYDERLLQRRRATGAGSAASDTDVWAHLLALGIAEAARAAPPYRRL